MALLKRSNKNSVQGKHASTGGAGISAHGAHTSAHGAHASSSGAHAAFSVDRRQRLVKTALGVSLAVVIALPLASLPQIADALEQRVTASSEITADGTCAKKEVVYAKLGLTGESKNLYVVNTFEGTAGEVVKDYGNYSSVTNLTDDQEILKSGESVAFDMGKNEFSYQGNMTSTNLPWKIAVDYYLDGQKINPSSLAGKSGELKMELSFKKNDAVDSTYFDNYLVQASVSLPQEKAKKVATEDGSIALSSSDTKVTFMSLPGKESACSLTATVEHFEMDGISIAAVPFSMNIDFSTDGLMSGFDELVSGTESINEGAQAIANGSSALEAGVAQVAAGSAQLNSKSESLVSGVNQYLDATQQLSAKVSALKQQSAALVAGAQQTQAALNGFANSLTAEQLAVLTDQQKQLLYGAQAGLNGTSQSTGLVAGIEAYTNGVTGEGSASNPTVASGLVALTSNNDQISAGLQEYTQGVAAVNEGLQKLSGSTNQLTSGAASLASGTSELASSVQGIPDKVQEQIDEALSSFDTSNFQPKSYVSSSNKDVTLVQFVMTTDEVKIPKAEEVVEEEKEMTIIDRFFALFA